MESNKKYLIMGVVFTMIIAIIGVTYAYWKGVIQGEGSDMSVNLGEVYILFTDNTVLSDSSLKPGWSTSKTFTIENQGGKDFKYDIYIKDLINTLVTEDYFQYKITSNNDGYNMEDYAPIGKSPEASDFDLGTDIIIGPGVKQTYTIEFRYVDDPNVNQSEDMGKMFSGVLAIRENTGKTLYSTLTNGSVYEIGERTDFSTPFGGTDITQGYNQTGKIYKVETSSLQTDYYFAGNPSDNWVKFADKWWRIIRTNSNEGTRLLYAGTSHDGQDGYINNTTYVWNSVKDNYQNVQWSNASFKDELVRWYDNNIGVIENNDKMVNSIQYCNDIGTDQSSAPYYYGAYDRLVNAKTPSNSICSIDGKITSKVGLMTADEVAYAGGLLYTNAPNTYYYRNSIGNECRVDSESPCSVIGSIVGSKFWWTMSPYSSNEYSFMFTVHGDSLGYLNNVSLSVSGAVRPVITLLPEVKVIGEGTTDDPYEPYL